VRFSDIHHQPRAISLLRRALASRRTHHAHLFDGPEGVGKERTALALAARLLCEDESLPRDADACGACRSCQLFDAGNHPDYHLIHRGLHKFHPDRSVRATKGLFLAVDVIRHFVIEPANQTPSLGRRRVFIIRDAERMNAGAQNALLKTLEEPPGAACLVLVTSSSQRLLPTIRSRCQHIAFDLLPPVYIEQRLAGECGLDSGDARALAALSQGRLGVALAWHHAGLLEAISPIVALIARRAFADPEAFGKAAIEHATSLAAAAAAENAEDAPDRAGGESKPSASKAPDTDQLRVGVRLVFMLVGAACRDAMLIGAGCDAMLALPALRDTLAPLAGTAGLPDAIEAIAHAEAMLDRNVAPQLTCECLAVALGEHLSAA